MPAGAFTTTLPDTEVMLSTHRSPSACRRISPEAVAFIDGAATFRLSAFATVPRGATLIGIAAEPIAALALVSVIERPTTQLPLEAIPEEASILTGPYVESLQPEATAPSVTTPVPRTYTPPIPAVAVNTVPGTSFNSSGTAAVPIDEPSAVIVRPSASIANGLSTLVEGTRRELEPTVTATGPTGLTICPSVSVPVEFTCTKPSSVANEMAKGLSALAEAVSVRFPCVGKLREEYLM